MRKHLVVRLVVSELLHPTELSSSMESLAAYDASVGSPGPVHQSQRTKRMRTSFKHHQLRTMKNYFAINQNPDAKDLKQLAQKTGLSKRVLQVRRGRSRLRYVRIFSTRSKGGRNEKLGGYRNTNNKKEKNISKRYISFLFFSTRNKSGLEQTCEGRISTD